MSTRGLRGAPQRGYVRNSRRKTALGIDLNMPPNQNQYPAGTSAHPNSENIQPQRGGSVPPAPIDVEAFDDDVLLSSPRAFAEAKNNSRRNRRGAVIVDVDSEERTSRAALNGQEKRRRVFRNQTIINCDVNAEGSSNSSKDNAQSVEPTPAPPKEPTFRCPVCMGPLVEEMSTKCGHIFCKACIRTAIAAQGKCPTCRKKISQRDTIRIYLPATE
ncbi:uncharacterized protein LOC127797269 [Diospyros lotus]|uniref:uncharacterized protein LOC127797269 n=1 Tax=Diospyros lotus TaxID=55363 RepID=UPI002258171D|nr:uncharacterized protein LOC127797269 [Diospyros lotus]